MLNSNLLNGIVMMSEVVKDKFVNSRKESDVFLEIRESSQVSFRKYRCDAGSNISLNSSAMKAHISFGKTISGLLLSRNAEKFVLVWNGVLFPGRE